MGMTEQTQTPGAPSPSTPTAEEFAAEITRLKAELAEANEALQGAIDKDDTEVEDLKKTVTALRQDIQNLMVDNKAFADKVERDQRLLSELLNVLGKELITSEGAVEVLNRIITERNEARSQLGEYSPQQVDAEEVQKFGEKVKNTCAEAAGPTGHWVRERVSIPTLLADFGAERAPDMVEAGAAAPRGDIPF